MPDLIVKIRNNRDIQISRGNFIFLRDEEGEVNWEWQYVSKIHSEIEDILNRSERMVDEVKRLLPNLDMGSLK